MAWVGFYQFSGVIYFHSFGMRFGVYNFSVYLFPSVFAQATGSSRDTLKIQKGGLWLLAITGLIKPPSQLK